MTDAPTGGKPEGRPDPIDLGLSAAVLALLAICFAWFKVEHAGFYRSVGVVLGAAALNAILPRRFRPAFFLLLSLGTFLWVLGLAVAAWIIGITLGVIALCRLPIPFRARCAVLAAVAVGLTALRARPGLSSIPNPVWPVLGSILIFRTILYLHDLRFGRERAGLVTTLSYFFLLPNAFFPLFPVVDAAGFRRARETALSGPFQRGLLRLTRGLLLVLLYRVVYHRMIQAEAVKNAGDLATHLLANYLLVLHVFGLLDLSVGLLQVFGLDLPEINRRSLEASGTTDYWRRNNLYWKEFVQKIVLHPVYFRLRRGGETRALVLGAIATFALTWALHLYQRFWLLGQWYVSLPDVLFWCIFGGLVVTGITIERRRRTAPAAPGGVLGRGLRVLGMLVLISLLWSLWTSPSLADWSSLLRAAAIPGGDARSALLVIAVLLLGVAAGRIPLEAGSPAGPFFRGARRANLTTIALLGGLLLGTTDRSWRALGLKLPRTVAALSSDSLNKRDELLLERGYYENMMAAGIWNGELARLYARDGETFTPFARAPLMRPTDDLRRRELRPGLEVLLFGVPYRTNRWGMRDRDYPLHRAPGTRRVALLGGSHVMGSGVGDDAVFEQLVEDRLNRRAGEAPVEILNFAVGRYSPLENLWLLENRALAFGPTAALLVSATGDLRRMEETALSAAADGKLFRDPALDDILATLRRTQSAGPSAGPEHRAAVFELYRWTLDRFLRVCKRNHVTATWIYLHRPGGPKEASAEAEDPGMLIEVARQAGFPVLDLSDVYVGSPSELWVSATDRHPNARGHRMIADRLERAFLERPEMLGLAAESARQATPQLP